MLNSDHLKEIAHLRDQDHRLELMRAVAELFLAGDHSHSGREAALFSDIFLRTIDDLESEGRAQLSGQLAKSASAPKSVVMRLARDEAAIADPVLRHSPVLDQDDLIKLALEMSNDHLVSISQREFLPETVTDVLIDRGDTTVKRHVASNDGADISPRGFEALASDANGDATLQECLASRLDLPKDLLKQVLPRLSDQVAERVRSGFMATLDKQGYGAAISRAGSAFSGARLKSSRMRVEALKLAQDVQKGQSRLDEVIVKLCSTEEFLEAVTVLATLSALPEDLVFEVMFKTENTPVSVTCRAAGLGRNAFEQFTRLRCQRLKLPASHASHAMSEFEAISDELARRLVRFVRVRANVGTQR